MDRRAKCVWASKVRKIMAFPGRVSCYKEGRIEVKPYLRGLDAYFAANTITSTGTGKPTVLITEVRSESGIIRVI
jgi:hypothetical protein